MQCPFCAEQIQDEAVICRFCSATKEGSQWKRDATPTISSPTRLASKSSQFRSFTMRSTGFLLMISAAIEALSLTSGVPLFGQVRTGAIAWVYHLVYVGLFLAMGAGLWYAKPWGWRILLVGSVYYTADRIRYLLDTQARAEEISTALGGIGSLLGADTEGLLNSATTLSVAGTLICWWAFIGYVYSRRDYFQPATPSCSLSDAEGP